MAGRANRGWLEPAVALAIAALLSVAWTVADWTRLSALILPDPDDMLRLVQIRDWLGGQAFSDLTQHRLGDGLAMHWSRLPDIVPAALILLLEPIAGRHGAELATVIVWPALLFTATLLLLARIANRLSDAPGAGITALLLGALAYPATGFFMPGRIDHHGLQLVLLLLAAYAMLGNGARTGLIIGTAIAASLAIGLETAPLCAVILAVLAIRWVIEGEARNGQLAACGAGLAGGTTFAALVLAPRIWLPLCDAFTPPIAALGVVAGVLLLLLGQAGRYLRAPPHRLATLGVAGVIGLAAIPLFAPVCLTGPYGAVPPLLRTLWLDHVAEAQPLLAAPLGVIVGYGGLMLAGLMASLIRFRRDRAMIGWCALLGGSAVLACIQLRVAPFGAALAVPVLATMVASVRQNGSPLRRVGAWTLSAGILYPLIGSNIGGGYAEPVRAPCLTAANLQRIAALGPIKIAVPLDMGAYVLAASDARVLAAPYHRNGAANLAQYRIFLVSPAAARAVAATHRIDAIAYCPGWTRDLDPMQVAAPGSIVKRATGQRDDLVILHTLQ